jgi:nucleotide-binding universal stress UspA family protein
VRPSAADGRPFFVSDPTARLAAQGRDPEIHPESTPLGARKHQAGLTVVSVVEALPRGTPFPGPGSTQADLHASGIGALRERRDALVAPWQGRIEVVTARLEADALDYRKPVQHLPKGWPRDQIPALAERIGANLAVLGTVARGGIPGLLMHNTAEILRHRLSCSVLALKPAGFVSLVTL